MSTSRWLKWAPRGQVIEKGPDTEPPKPSKIFFGGFEGAPSELLPIIEPGSAPPLEAAPAEKEAAASQIVRWVGARCARGRGIFGSEKSLWHDYAGWSQKHKLSAISRELFSEILNQLFRRDMHGWWGIALALDVAAVERYIM